MVRTGSGTEIPCAFGTSGLMRIAAFELRSQACQVRLFLNVVLKACLSAGVGREPVHGKAVAKGERAGSGRILLFRDTAMSRVCAAGLAIDLL